MSKQINIPTEINDIKPAVANTLDKAGDLLKSASKAVYEQHPLPSVKDVATTVNKAQRKVRNGLISLLK